MGHTLQSFLPPAQPYAVSSAFPLMTFKHLQGLAPRKSSPPDPSGLDSNQARSSHGPFTRQGAFLATKRAFTPLSPHAVYSTSRKRTVERHSRVSLAKNLAYLSQDPPTLFRLCDLLIHHVRSSIIRILESPPQGPQYVTVPPKQPLFESVTPLYQGRTSYIYRPYL